MARPISITAAEAVRSNLSGCPSMSASDSFQVRDRASRVVRACCAEAWERNLITAERAMDPANTSVI
eukprot:13408542-Alexandrium_andersonii.AAC.1